MGSLSLVQGAGIRRVTDSIVGLCSPCETHLARAETAVLLIHLSVLSLYCIYYKPSLRPTV